MEHLNNLPPFYVGQKVVYITGENMPKGTIDTVIDIIKPNCKCGYFILLKNNLSKGEKARKLVECIDCGFICTAQEHNKTMGYWLAKSFRPLQEQTFPLISMKKVLEEQLVCSN